MSYSSNYIITTLSSSVQQRTFDPGVSGTQAPMAYGVASGPPTLRQRGTPYLATEGSEPTELTPISDAPSYPSQEISVGLISSTSTVYNPGTEYIPTLYTQLVSSSNPDNTTPMHVGSWWIEGGKTYLTFGALITDMGSGGSTVHVELKRNSNGASLLTMTNSSSAGNTWRAVSSSNVSVSSTDWYDIYISASSNPATSSIRGVFYQI